MNRVYIALVRFKDKQQHIYSIYTIENENEYIVCGTYNTKNGVLRLRDIHTNPLTKHVSTIITKLLEMEGKDIDKDWRYCIYY